MSAQWNPTPIVGGANWGGNPQVATKQQLLSTSAGLLVDITDWSLYSAVSDVNLNGHSLLNVNGVSSFATNVSSINAIYIQTVWLSTQAMNVSSINQSTIDFFNGTVTIEGNTSITTQGITTNNTTITANGTTGGGGNNPTSGGSGNTTFGMINNAIGAVMDTVSKTQQAISGVLNNTGAVLFQTYYAVETAGAIIDLANGAVSLATNAQAMYDTREQNLIAGPRGNPGQTSYVYETINGTTQFQFSTLGASTYSVFRTTDQKNPNQTFGQEIFTSTIIPAGSKVLRSVSDPYQFPIISTQLLSTTNYLQSFGQWHAILEPEYVLNASTIITANLSTTFANITVLSSAKITASSINITGGLTFSTLAGNPAGQYDISRTFASTTSIFDGISSVTNNILSYTLSNTMTSGGGNTSPKWNLVNPGLTTLDATNESFWSKTLAILTGGQYGYSVWVQLGQANSVNDYIDFKNESSVVGIDIYAYPTIFGGFGSPSATFRIPPGNINIYRFVWTGSTWTYGLAPSESPQTTINQFTINQQSLQTILSTNRALVINSGVTSFNSQTNMLYTEIDDLYVQNILASSFTTTIANISTLSTQTLDASYAQINTLYVCTLFGSTITVNNIIDNITSTTNAVFDTVSVSSIQSINMSTQNIFSQIASLSTTNLSTMTSGNAFITNLSSLNLCNLNLSSSNAFISTLSTINLYTTNATFQTIQATNEIVQSIQGTSGYFSSLFALSTTTQQASISSIVPYNAFTIPTTIVYGSTGGDQYWTAPAGITFIDVILIGAGAQSNTVNSGGLVSGRLAVTPGTTYKIIAGNSAGGYGGGGTNGLTYAGGRSAIALSGNDLVTAGGAGGNGATGSAYYGGAGGGLTGGTGQGSSYAGQGGTQSAGGAGGTRTGSGANGVAGTQYVGANALDAGGGGGGGWYGGGSGADNGIGGGGGRSGGGGGGSSYVANLYGVVVNTQGGGAGNNTSGSVQITYYANESILNIAAPTNIVGTTNITGNTSIYGSTLVGGVFTLGGVRAIRNFVFSATQSWAHNALNGSAIVKDGAGNTYNSSQWVMNTGLMAIAEIFGQNFAPAFNYIQTDQHVDSDGNYYISWSIVANVDRSGNNEQMQWNITMFPKEMTQTMTAGSYAAGFPSTLYNSTILYQYPNTALSSIHASTLTFQASENISLLAGNFAIPTYFSTGSITVGGTNQASVLANIVAIGAQTDVDIAGYTGNVNIAAGSNINLNGSNGIGLNSSNAINLTASSNVTINTVTTIQLPGTASIPSVSPLALTSGNQYDGAQHYSQIEFQFYGGGFNHYISSRHDANVVYGSGNAIDFWLYSVTTGGNAQTASSAPGTGNVNSMSITASNVVINRPIQISDTSSGGTGTLTVDSGNHLYWNGTFIA